MLAEKFAYAIERKFNEANADRPHSGIYNFEVESGRKFDKIVQTYGYPDDRHAPQRSVHAFVEKKTGALIKAAGWNAPAKIKTGWATKYNLLTDFDLAVEKADPFGGYLYQGAN